MEGNSFWGHAAPLTVDLCHLEGIRGISPRRFEAVFSSPVWEIELFLYVLPSDTTPYLKRLVGNVGYVVSAKSSQKSVGLTCRRHVGPHVGNMWSVVTLFWTTPLATCRRVGDMSASVCHTLYYAAREQRNRQNTCIAMIYDKDKMQ